MDRLCPKTGFLWTVIWTSFVNGPAIQTNFLNGRATWTSCVYGLAFYIDQLCLWTSSTDSVYTEYVSGFINQIYGPAVYRDWDKDQLSL